MYFLKILLKFNKVSRRYAFVFFVSFSVNNTHTCKCIILMDVYKVSHVGLSSSNFSKKETSKIVIQPTASKHCNNNTQSVTCRREPWRRLWHGTPEDDVDDADCSWSMRRDKTETMLVAERRGERAWAAICRVFNTGLDAQLNIHHAPASCIRFCRWDMIRQHMIW